MTHQPIRIHRLGLSFPHKTCFADFEACVGYSSRIAVIGRNGSGKSSLLRMLQGRLEPTSGRIAVPEDVTFGCVPQIISAGDSLSGGQRFNQALTAALSLDPNVLLLDEPTNHLDRRNRDHLLRMLRAYAGTLIAVTHDPELLRQCVDTLWHIHDGRIQVFTGGYDDYMAEARRQGASLEQERERLTREQRAAHQALMREQESIAKSRAAGRKKIAEKRWMKSTGDLKAMKAQKSQGGKFKAIDEKKQALAEQLAELRLPEVIAPNFAIRSQDLGRRTVVTITAGSAGYEPGRPLFANLSLTLAASGRVAIVGYNGSGKTTFAKALMGDPAVIRGGEWQVPKPEAIGYLDQHYGTLDPEKTVLESIRELAPDWPHAEARRFLNTFLFRKNEEVHAPVRWLSGGEKARLSLARIAARPPQLLILDEITNNLDLETREHVVEVLRAYPGAMIVISHEPDFLERIGVEEAVRLGA